MSKSFRSRNLESAPEADEAQLYGPAWTTALSALQTAIKSRANLIVDQFYDRLAQLPDSSPLIELLSAAELGHLKQQQIDNLLTLASPELCASWHRTLATRIGDLHARVGLAKKDLVHSHDILLLAVRGHVDVTQHAEALSVLARRLIRDLAWQIEAGQVLQMSRHEQLLNVTRLAWGLKSYTDLIHGVTETLSRHPEIVACSLGRPDSAGKFRYESVAGENIRSYLSELELNDSAPIMIGDLPEAQGPTGRAWKSGTIEHCINTETDPRMLPWRAAALRHGFRSSAALPMNQPGGKPTAILTLYSSLPGGFSSVDQRAFLAQLQTILVFAVARIESQEGRTPMVSFTERQHWASLLRSRSLEMHYQPLLGLKDWKIIRVEALARLRDGARLLTPGEFLPTFSSDDLLELYARGLDQALSQRESWRAVGLDLPVSINLPPSAIGDVRYLRVTRDALSRHKSPAAKLTLEVLETHEVPSGIDVRAELLKFKALGVNLSEDDLGTGHSSLSRLRALPFDCIKIDRSLVARAAGDASDGLRFIYQLTRLGHMLGKFVTVEGVEDPGMLEAVMVLGADAVQGYVLAKPMGAAELSEWVRRTPLPTAPDARDPKSQLAKLARLLLWEEYVHLLLIEAPASATRARPVLPELPFRSIDRVIQEALLSAAVDYGPDSAEYERARQHLIEALAF